jgi:DNA repair protein RadD
MITLRPNQIAAADAVEQAFRNGFSRPLVDSCVGSGKSLIFAELARREVARGGRVIIGAHTRELVEQNAGACRLLGLPVGINAASLGERCWRAPVISAAIQSVYKHAQSFGPITLLMVDECFPADTLILTPKGSRPIGTIMSGDTICHALGEGRVEARSRRLVTELVEVEFVDGRKLRCTEAHPLFTLQGWQSAGSLAAGSVVLRHEGLRALRRYVSALDTEERSGRNHPGHETRPMGEATILLNILFEEAGKRDARSAGAREDDGSVTLDRSSTESARWQRLRVNEGTGGAFVDARAGLGSGTCGTDLSTARQRLSDKLQDRRSEPNVASRDRGGREFAQREAAQTRYEKDTPFGSVRVARVSRIKLASPCFVYNLQVAGHPSYFANGFLAHNCHLVPHSESGMYRELHRSLGYPRMPGGSGTVFRLQGGSLVDGEGAPFESVVYTYSILDGIRDGFLCPAFSLAADDKIDPSKLRTRNGDYTSESSDAQMIAAMDNHIAQMVYLASDRRAWLVFEASRKSARAMAQRMNEWNIPTGLVLGESGRAAELARARTIEDFRAGRLRALVNVNALTTGFDVQQVDLLVMRRRTQSLGLYIQMVGRVLRTIGGNIGASIAAGKADGAVLDFAGNIEEHGPLDFIEVKETKAKLVPCESCGTRNSRAAAKCWSCGETMFKNCPACLEAVPRHVLDCPHCSFDMRSGQSGDGDGGPKLLETPSGADLIRAWSKSGVEREGGWQPIRKCYRSPDGIIIDTDTRRAVVAGQMESHATAARWARFAGEQVDSILIPNGQSRTSALQVAADGRAIVVPLPPECAQCK